MNKNRVEYTHSPNVCGTKKQTTVKFDENKAPIIPPETLESILMLIDFLEEDQKLLIVEGSTDRDFIKKHLGNVKCEIVNKSGTQTNKSKSKTRVIYVTNVFNNSPKTIETICKLNCVSKEHIEKIKFQKMPEVFGMIDKDFDPDDKYLNESKLFVTDTHDLETLMLSTEEDILQKIEGCKIEDTDVKKALFMAYQLGKMRELCFGHISLEGLSAENGEEVEYSSFFNDKCRISLKDLISYLNKKATETISQEKENEIFNQLSQKNYLDKEDEKGRWKSKLDSFDPDTTKDLWNKVNGHDILSLLRYVNKDAAERFKPFSETTWNSSKPQLNRKFEIALIKAYDPNNFKKTKICRRMREAGIVEA